MDEECIVMGPFDNMCLLFLKWSGAEEAVNHSITVDFTSGMCSFVFVLKLSTLASNRI